MIEEFTTSVYWLHYKSHTDPLTEGYIGVSKDPEFRLWGHINDAKKGKHVNKYLARVLLKHKDEIIQTILYTGTSESAYDYENFLRCDKNIGWNIAVGGSKPPSQKGVTFSDERCQKISQAKIGKKKPPMSDDVKKKISESSKGKKLKEETKEKIRASRQKQVFSEADRKKMSDSHIGKIPANAVAISTPLGIFQSYKQAGIMHGVSGTTIKKWIDSGKNGFERLNPTGDNDVLDI